MDFIFDHIDDLPEDERKRFLERVADDESLRTAYATWRRLSAAIRQEQSELLGDRTILVAYALERSGRREALSQDDLSRLDSERERLDEAIEVRPGFADLVERIQSDASLFEEKWNQLHFAPPSSDRSPRRRSSTLRPARIGWRLAAVAATVTFVGMLLFVLSRDASRITIQVADGSVEQHRMGDGTTVRLVGPASLRYVPSDARSRPSRVDLSGNAYFDVVGGTSPFIVETATARVSVLGTNFGVRSSDDVTEVVLASGRLSVTSRNGSSGVTLESGFSSRVPKGGSPSDPYKVDLTDALSWSGLFVFRAAQMTDIAERLSEHYHTTVRVAATFAGQRVSGTFDRDRELADILDVVATSLGASVVATEDGYMLEAPPG